MSSLRLLIGPSNDQAILKTLDYSDIRKLCRTKRSPRSSPRSQRSTRISTLSPTPITRESLRERTPKDKWSEACNDEGLFRSLLERDYGSPVVLPAGYNSYISYYKELLAMSDEIRRTSGGNPDTIESKNIELAFRFGYDAMVRRTLNRYSADIKLKDKVIKYCSFDTSNVYCEKYIPLLDNILIDIDNDDTDRISIDKFDAQTEKWISSQALLNVLVNDPTNPIIGSLVDQGGTMLDFTEPASFSTFEMILRKKGGAYILLSLASNKSTTVKLLPKQRSVAVDVLASQ